MRRGGEVFRVSVFNTSCKSITSEYVRLSPLLIMNVLDWASWAVINDPRGRTPNVKRPQRDTQNSSCGVWGRSLGELFGVWGDLGGQKWLWKENVPTIEVVIESGATERLAQARRARHSPSAANSDRATADDVQPMEASPPYGCQNPFMLGTCMGKYWS